MSIGKIKVVPTEQSIIDSLGIYGIEVHHFDANVHGLAVGGMTIEIVVPGSSEVIANNGEELSGETLANAVKSMLEEICVVKSFRYVIDDNLHWTMYDFEEARENAGLDENLNEKIMTNE